MNTKFTSCPFLRRLQSICQSITFCAILLFCCNLATAQPFSLWVIPIDSSAYPVGNNTTDNAELNQIFEDFHVEKYYFLDYIDMWWVTGSIEPVCIIDLKDEGSQWELCKRLHNYCGSLFKRYILMPNVSSPPIGPMGYFQLHYIDPSARPCSPTRSCNEQLNAILDRYAVSIYEYFAENACLLYMMFFEYTKVADLYFELLPLNHLFDEIVIIFERCIINDKSNASDTEEVLHWDNASIDYLLKRGYEPCNVGVPDNSEPESVIVSPNPVHDYLTISGINPERITLYDWQGRTVLAKSEQINGIDMRSLPNGIYLLHIITDSGIVYVEKIIKE